MRLYKIEDELPPHRQLVVLARLEEETGWVAFGYRNEGRYMYLKNMRIDDGSTPRLSPTHWAYMPALPTAADTSARGYEGTIASLSPMKRARLLLGNWRTK